jgi:hypothetical protein
VVEELNELEKHVGTIKVPLSYADQLYSLRSNINLVRKKFTRA